MVASQQLDFFLNCDAPVNLAWGAVRSGKSVITSTCFCIWCAFINPSDEAVALVGKTERTIMRNIVYPMIKPFYLEDMVEHLGKGYIDIGGTKAYIVGGNDSRSASKIQGVTLSGALIDEMSTLDEDFVTMLFTRLSEPEARVFATTNPDAPSHWLKEKYIDKCAPDYEGDDKLDWKTWHFTLDDNPYITDEKKDQYRRELKASGEQWFRRYYKGDWIAAEGSIYHFDPDGPAVIDEIPEEVQIKDAVVGVDYGAKHATCFVYLGLGTDNNIYAMDEYYWDGKYQMRTDEQHSQAYRAFIANKPKRYGVAAFVDASAQHMRYQLEADGLGPAHDSDNSPGSVIDGINNVAVLLGTGRLKFIRNNTKTLRKQLAGYVWDDLAEEKGEPKPSKKADHACDALRYGIVGCFYWWDHWVTWRGSK